MSLCASHWKPTGECDCPFTGLCCECSQPCKDHDLVGNATEQDGLGSWPKFWCSNCINTHLEEDARSNA